MQRDGKAWRHVVLNTRNTWLHGDPRGFRDRKHRIHSSGDYRNPPPAGENARLHHWYQQRAGNKVVFPTRVWTTVADSIRAKLTRLEIPILAIAVGAVHVHLLAQLPTDRGECRRLLGFAKRFATESVKHDAPGKLWAQGGTLKPIRDHAHQRNAFVYITTAQRPSWVWDFREGGRLVC